MKRITLNIKMKMILDVNDDQNMENILDSIVFSEIDTDNDIDVIAFKVTESKVSKTYELE